jgi:hypothetical protein
MSAAVAPLYVIAAEKAALADLLVENNGELTPEVEAQLAALDASFRERLAACAHIARNLEAESVKHKAEADRQAVRAATLQRSFETLKAYMKREMTVAGELKVEGIARIQSNGGVLPVLFEGDAEKLPEPFRRLRYELDGEAVRKAAAAGETLPDGVRMGERGTQIRILV